MIIKIENFANIRNLEMSLVEGKLNFLYGISGSGKSSIAKALTIDEGEYEGCRTFGCSEEVSVETDKDITFKVFNDEAVSEFIIAKSGEGVYDVLYGENQELVEIKKELYGFLEKPELRDIKNIIANETHLINELEEQLKIGRTSTGRISKTGLMKSLVNPKEYVDGNPDIDLNIKAWIKNGYIFVENDLCPFCGKKMEDEIIDKLKKIINELPKEYETVINASELLKKSGINIDVKKINDAAVQNNLKQQLENKYKVLKELQTIDDALNISINDDKSLERTVKIKISEDIVNLFEKNDIDIQKLITQLNENTQGYTLNKKKYNGILRATISRNIKKINHHIANFGIDYELIKTNCLSANEGYSLIHKKIDFDSSDSLSTGERNVISLILFLISYSKEYDIIIDDPASSYDEYRREQILRFIIDFIYNSKNESKRTTIILSHDQIFLKFLCKDMLNNKYNNRIGKVGHIENINGNCRIVEIEPRDMAPILIHVLSALKNSNSYAQKVINLRLYYELKNLHSLEYGYLSAILHSKRDNLSKEDMDCLLQGKNTSEEDILNNIQLDTGIELETFDPKNYIVKMNDFSNFEKMCFAREWVTKPEKDELSNIVHFNYAMQHLLNPYKFNFQSENSYSILDSYLQQLNDNNAVLKET